MGAKDQQELIGNISLGVVQSVDEDTFRATVKIPGIGDCKYTIANPSPLLGYLPEPGTQVAMYDRHGFAKRIIATLSEAQPSRTPTDMINSREEAPGTVPKLKVGEIYVGKYGRAYFNNNGDVLINARKNRANLELLTDKAMARISAYNFEFYTNGQNIRIGTEQSLTAPQGDILVIEKNVPAPPQPDSMPKVLPTNISRLKIDDIGNFTGKIGPIASGSYLQMTVFGGIELSNSSSGVAINADFSARMYSSYLGNLCAVKLDSDVDIYCIGKSGFSELLLGNTGQVSLTNMKGTIAIDKLGGVGATSGAATTFDMTPLGDISMVSPLKFDVTSGATAGVTAATSITLTAPSVVINSPNTTLMGLLTFAASKCVSPHPFEIETPKFHVTSPDLELSGNIAIKKNTKIEGMATLLGALNVAGALTFVGLSASSGGDPLMSEMATAWVPVQVMTPFGPRFGYMPVVF